MQVGSGKLLVLEPAEQIPLPTTELFASLEQDGFDVFSAPPPDYLDRLAELNPDLALLPLTDDGAALLETMIQLANRPPVLVFGATEQAELAGQFIASGAEEYWLMNEHNPELIRPLIERTIQNHQALASLQEEKDKLASQIDHMTKDHTAAFDVQQKLLPEPQQFGDIAFSYYIVPRAGMSGDAVNCFSLSDGRLLFYLADVAGHGILGGVIATALTLTAKNLSDPEFDPTGQSSSDLLVWFNKALLALQLDRHVAMFLGVISRDRTSLQYSSAAHFPGTILCQGGACLYLELGGLPLGVCETEYETQQVDLEDVFELVLFSDGVLEILPQDSLKNREKHLISLVESGSRSVSAISKQLSLEGRSEVPDDIALLTIRRDIKAKDPVAP
jgi:sigma-B regulation protein RsbU (phosphoserine phosphatase)